MVGGLHLHHVHKVASKRRAIFGGNGQEIKGDIAASFVLIEKTSADLQTHRLHRVSRQSAAILNPQNVGNFIPKQAQMSGITAMPLK